MATPLCSPICDGPPKPSRWRAARLTRVAGAEVARPLEPRDALPDGGLVVRIGGLPSMPHSFPMAGVPCRNEVRQAPRDRGRPAQARGLEKQYTPRARERITASCLGRAGQTSEKCLGTVPFHRA